MGAHTVQSNYFMEQREQESSGIIPLLKSSVRCESLATPTMCRHFFHPDSSEFHLIEDHQFSVYVTDGSSLSKVHIVYIYHTSIPIEIICMHQWTALGWANW